MEIGQILNEIKNDPIYVEAISAGIDVEKTILENFDKWKRYTSIKTVVTYAKSELNKKIQSKNDLPLVGINVGQCDRFGTKMPVTFPILSQDGRHTSVVNYDVNKIPSPGRVELKIRKNANFENYTITDVVKFDPYNRDQIIERLMRVSKTPDAISFDALQRGQVIVVRGIISWVNPSKKFSDKVVVGNNEVYMTTEDTIQRFVPVVDISLQKGGSNSVVFQLQRQRYAKPIYDIADFEEICQAAVNETPDPNEQAKLVKAGVSGRMIIGVGEVSGLKAGDKGNFINLRAFSLYEYDSSFIKDSPPIDSYSKPVEQKQIQQPLQTTQTTSVQSPVVSQEASSAPYRPQSQQSQPVEPIKQQSPTTKRNLIEKIASQLITLSRAFDRPLGTFNAEEVKRLLKLGDDVPDVVIEEAIKYAILPHGDD